VGLPMGRYDWLVIWEVGLVTWQSVFVMTHEWSRFQIGHRGVAWRFVLILFSQKISIY
jgi:hypothetical protein